MPADPSISIRACREPSWRAWWTELVRKSIEPCRHALKDAGLSTSDVDAVLLVGGMTRMPAIQEAVKSFFGKEPTKGVNPDEVVALGAAIQAGVLGGDVKDILAA